jgi:hypothetical protein
MMAAIRFDWDPNKSPGNPDPTLAIVLDAGTSYTLKAFHEIRVKFDKPKNSNKNWPGKGRGKGSGGTPPGQTGNGWFNSGASSATDPQTGRPLYEVVVTAPSSWPGNKPAAYNFILEMRSPTTNAWNTFDPRIIPR